MQQTVWFEKRPSYRALFIFAAAFFSLMFCLCFITVPFKPAIYIAPWFLAFVVAIALAYRATRFCSSCDRVLNRNLIDKPAWCWCGKLVEPEQMLLGSPGEIDLAEWHKHSQPVSQLIGMMISLVISDRCEWLRIHSDGAIYTRADKEYEMVPMPEHLAPAVTQTLRALINDDGELRIHVPLKDNQRATIQVKVCFEPENGGEQALISLEQLPKTCVVSVPTR